MMAIVIYIYIYILCVLSSRTLGARCTRAPDIHAAKAHEERGEKIGDCAVPDFWPLALFKWRHTRELLFNKSLLISHWPRTVRMGSRHLFPCLDLRFCCVVPSGQLVAYQPVPSYVYTYNLYIYIYPTAQAAARETATATKPKQVRRLTYSFLYVVGCLFS